MLICAEEILNIIIIIIIISGFYVVRVFEVNDLWSVALEDDGVLALVVEVLENEEAIEVEMMWFFGEDIEYSIAVAGFFHEVVENDNGQFVLMIGLGEVIIYVR